MTNNGRSLVSRARNVSQWVLDCQPHPTIPPSQPDIPTMLQQEWQPKKSRQHSCLIRPDQRFPDSHVVPAQRARQPTGHGMIPKDPYICQGSIVLRASSRVAVSCLVVP